MKNNDEDYQKLQAENARLRAELAALKGGKSAKKTFSAWLANHSTNVFAGRSLKKSLIRLYTELPRDVKKETMADVSAHLIWRMTRVGMFTVLIALVPLMVMAVQTLILSVQNDKLEAQNQLIQNQNTRLDQQIHLEEGNRRSSFIFLMSNIMDKVDEELKNRENNDRKLSDELIGRIVSLSQTLRPYRYLENDELIEKHLSPERGQLLFSLVNSLLHEETMDKIFEKADFSYADLQGANLSNSYLRRVKLTNSSFTDANFQNSFLEGATFTSANLTGADFENANLLGVQFDTACLHKCNFFNVTANDCNLEYADMRGCRASGNFSNVLMEGLILEDAELGVLRLDGAQVRTKASKEGFTKYTKIYDEFIEKNYDWEEVMVANEKGNDSYYRLIQSPDSQMSMMDECTALVLKIVESNSKIRALKKEMAMKDEGLEVLEEASPFGSSEISVSQDSVYIFRIVGEEDSAILAPKMIVEFNPMKGTLTEIRPSENEARLPLQFSKPLYKQMKKSCKTGQ